MREKYDLLRYRKAAVLLLCLLFVLLPDVRFTGPSGDAPDADARNSAYHQQHQYAPPAASHQTPTPDASALPVFSGLAAAGLAIALRSLHADSRIPILCKHRMLRPLKFGSSFLSLFRVPI